MSVNDGGDDIGGNPEQGARVGNTITDPAGGQAVTMGGEKPSDWKGPLPEVPPGKARGDWCGDPGCGGDLESGPAATAVAVA